MKCLFENSKYYKLARANPRSIIEPIGYHFLANDKKQKINRNVGQFNQIFTSDLHLVRILSTSNRRTTYRLDEILKLTDLERKNYYTGLFDYINKEVEPEILDDMISSYFPQFKQSDRDIELASLLSSISLQNLFNIQNYSLSNYFFYLQATHSNQYDYLLDLFDQQFIQYKVQGFYSAEEPYGKANNVKQPSVEQIQNVQYVEALIQKINLEGRLKDPLFEGIHFFVGVNTFETKYSTGVLKEELGYLCWLQFYITLMTGILADGQSAILPLRSTFRHKTNEYIFMLKMMFNGKVNLIKPLSSNIFKNNKYIYCQDYCRQNGDIIHQYLLSNYHILKLYKESKLLLNPKPMYREQFETSISSFNDTIINKGFKTYIKQFKNNSNVRYYPPKNKLIERVEQMKTNSQSLLTKIVHLIPQIELHQANNFENNKKKQTLIEKQAAFDIINNLTQQPLIPSHPKRPNPTSQHQSIKQKPSKLNKKEDILEYFQNQNKKKSKNKTKKKQQ